MDPSVVIARLWATFYSPTKWETFNQKLRRKYFVKKISDDDNLMIYLQDENGLFTIVYWDCIVESYTCTEETNRTRNYNDNTATWTFFEIYDSKYIQWLTEESVGILEEKGLHHICIVAENLIVDVVAAEYPHITYEQI